MTSPTQVDSSPLVSPSTGQPPDSSESPNDTNTTSTDPFKLGQPSIINFKKTNRKLYKTIQIDAKIKDALTDYCNSNGFKISNYVESLITADKTINIPAS